MRMPCGHGHEWRRMRHPVSLPSRACFATAREYSSPLRKTTALFLLYARMRSIGFSGRVRSDEPPLDAYRDKVAALVAASPGGIGGLRGLVPLRMVLANIGVHVIPQQLAVPKGLEAFEADGDLFERPVQTFAEKRDGSIDPYD